VNRLVAIIGLVICALATVPPSPAAKPLQTPPLIEQLAAVDRSVYQCQSIDQGTECRRKADPADRIAGEPATEIVLFYRSGTLVRAVFAFSEAELDPLVERLSADLGTPTRGHELLKAGMAGLFENIYYIWILGDQVWFVEQYFERVTTSGLWHMDATEFAAFQSEREQRRVRGARDL
jgi:hypothetical protein